MRGSQYIKEVCGGPKSKYENRFQPGLFNFRALQKRSPQFGPGFANFLGTPKPNRPTPRPLTPEELEPGFPTYNTELFQTFVTQPPIFVPLEVNHISDHLKVEQIEQTNSTSFESNIAQGNF